MAKSIFISVALFITAIVYVFSDEKILFEEIVLGSIILFSYYFFLSKLAASKRHGLKVFVVIFLLLLTIPQTIGAASILCYNTIFAYGQASSILNTSFAESSSMLSSSPLIAFIFVFFALVNICAVKSLTGLNIKSKFFTYFLASIWLLIPLFSVGFKMYKNIGGESALAYFFRNSTFSKYRTLILAYEPNKEFNVLKTLKPDYSHLVVESQGVETVVLVIGESARRQNMSIYGYDRNTTPYQLAERDHMKIYNNMVSSAGITQISVPLLLSHVSPDVYKEKKSTVSNNVLNLASYLGYKTYWLSTQEQGNHYVSSVSNMAYLTDSAKWFTGFDEVLVPELMKLKKEKNKKFIVLHINGSHSNACDRYPKSLDIFTGNNSAIDCYDNSILYTDKILGDIYSLLKEENAAVIYLSDHGEKFINDRYIHADTKEASMIPYTIWFGSQVSTHIKDLKVIEQMASLEVNYFEIARLLGVQVGAGPWNNGTIRFLKSNMEAVEYQNLEN